MRRSLRAKAAILLAVTMATTNITSMAATNVGTPQSAEKTQEEEKETDSTQSNADRDPVTSVDETAESILNGAENRAGETSGTWEGFTWSLDADVLTIEGKGAMPDKGDRNDYPWQEFSDIADRIVIGDGITHIGKYAFAEFTFLTGVELSDSVDSIGREAFVSCENLSDINVRDDIGYIHGRAFGNCDNLPAETLVAKGKGLSGDEHWTMTQAGILTVGGTGKTSSSWDGISIDRVREVVINDGITTIGQSSFSFMSNLVKVSIPASVTTIEKWAFQFCESLTDISVPDTVTTIGTMAFEGCDSLVNVPNEKGACGEKLWWELNREGTLTVRGSGDMSGAIPWKSTPTSSDENIKKVILEEGVTSIANNAFHSCTNLTEVSIPSTMKKIGQSAFRGCTALTSVTLPDGPLSIADYAFQDCTSLKSINVSEETSLGMDVFKGCTSLSGVDISPSGQYGENLRWKLTEDGTLTFTGTGELKPKKGEATPVWKGSGRDKVKKVVIGEGVTLVGGYEFNGCKNLTEVTLPEQSLTSIEDYAFLG
ncbi:MAG: leucine-rich repeat domain-containing protein, partial [Hungatella sp.]|nr:leucine-rich repeat domain-containing protein [Hungatella sp.]